MNPERWVVKGEATKWDFFKTGLWGPKAPKQSPFIKGSGLPFKPITGDVPTDKIAPPKISLKEPFALIKKTFRSV